MSQTHYTAWTVNSSQVPSTQTNFAALIVGNDARYKTTGNGGHVAGSSGFDIRPYSDSGLTSALTYELVPGTYSATTGTFQMYVLVASLADASVVYLGYGDSALNTDGSSTSTWNSNFKCVLHMQEAAGGSAAVKDSTANANHGTDSGSPTFGASGKWGTAITLDGTNDQIDCGNGSSLNVTTANYTLSVWLKRATSSSGGPFVVRGVAGSAGYVYGIGLTPATTHQIKGTKYAVVDLTLGSVPADTNFNLLTLTYSSTAGLVLYINGSSNATDANTQAFVTSTSTFLIGTGESGIFLPATIQELRVLNTPVTANWETTYYNNTSANSSFWSQGTEVAVGGGGRTTRNTRSWDLGHDIGQNWRSDA